MLLWVINAISFWYIFTLDERLLHQLFALKLLARQTLLEIMILSFSVLIDPGRVTMSSEICPRDLFKERSFQRAKRIFLRRWLWFILFFIRESIFLIHYKADVIYIWGCNLCVGQTLCFIWMCLNNIINLYIFHSAFLLC